MNPADWQICQWVWDLLAQPIGAAAAAIIAQVCNQVQPIAFAALALWVVWAGIQIAGRRMDMRAAVWQGICALILVGMINAQVYAAWVQTVWLTVIPDALGQIFGGHPTPMAGLDKLVQQLGVNALRSYEALPGWSLKSIPLGIAIIAYAIFAVAAIGTVLVQYIRSTLLNILAVAAGPIMLMLLAIPSSRKFAAEWLGFMAANVAIQVLGTLAIDLYVTTVGNMLSAAIHTNDNAIVMLWGLVKTLIAMFFFVDLMKSVPAMAQAINGGTFHGAMRLSDVMMGGAARAMEKAAALPVRGAAAGVRRASSSVNNWRTKRAIRREIEGGD